VLYTEKLLAELERKREQLVGYQGRYQRHLDAYRAALASLGARFPSAGALRDAQAARAPGNALQPALGALPTGEYDGWRAAGGSGCPVLRLDAAFAHHQEARIWAERLRGVATFAVDGSQLPPWRDASIPLALVQVGLFDNPHQPPAAYVKDVVTELLTPDDLLVADPDTADARTGEALSYTTAVVHLRRFELEVRTIAVRMAHHAERRAADADPAGVVAFYDGSLIVSFALTLPEPYRKRYVAAARELLAASARYRVPLVGYIDTSYARDVVTMLRGVAEAGTLPETRGVHDALLWHNAMQWGDRTPAFISARDDLTRMGYGDQAGDIAFVYFQAARDRPAARLEFPRWLLEAGLLDAVMDVVRAETIAGGGYPYPLETADAAAVISAEDRAHFYALVQRFAEGAGLSLSFSRKALSKSRRRI
jgi:NurA domain